MIYLICGTPRTGKSTLAKKIVKEKGIAFVSTEVVLHMVSDTLPELHLTEPYIEIPKKFFPYLCNLIKHVHNSLEDYVIEGDIFTPVQVTELKKSYSIKVCFLGFSKITIKDIQEHVGQNDWLGDLSEIDLHNLPQWIMEKSLTIEDECKKQNLAYFDMSDGLYEDNIEKVYEYLFQR